MLDGMEKISHTPVATPQQRQALIRNQNQRLRDQAEALLRAFEVLEPPQTYTEATQAAKALITVEKAIDSVNRIKPHDERIADASVQPPHPAAEREAFDAGMSYVNIRLGAIDLIREARRAAKNGAPS